MADEPEPNSNPHTEVLDYLGEVDHDIEASLDAAEILITYHKRWLNHTTAPDHPSRMPLNEALVFARNVALDKKCDHKHRIRAARLYLL